MSIPPLVCSTPPPPDQCEDDKDTDDYELQYNLSQDDEEGIDYDFRHFSTCSNYNSHTPKKQADELNKEIKTEISEINNKQNIPTVENDFNDIIIETNKHSEEKLKLDEDINIEDLNLKVDDESSEIHMKDISIEVTSTSIESDDNSLKDNLKENSNVISKIHVDDNVCLESSSTYHLVEEAVTESDFYPDEVAENQITETTSADFDIAHKSLNSFDDDFDDFQFIRSNSIKVGKVLETCTNPWANKEASNNNGDFSANFDDNEIENHNITLQNVNIKDESGKQPCDVSDESEFGDFDDFKSSALQTEMQTVQEPEYSNSVPILNIQTSEDESLVIENINKLLSSIFDEEIIETQNEIEVKLEILLSETWGYLTETDIRQPYIVNWNNSFGQKTLLRALCIDSRNILFGPKWCHHMPKYAANLSAAPLQPQKPLSSSNIIVRNETVNDENSITKSGTWTDPFTSDGQEFTYAETLLLDLEHLMATLDQITHNQSTLKISELLSHACNTEGESSITETRQTDLDVFEATKAKKSEKNYPSSLDIQPIRQINLPETHIFTPTDSETPRSKTHYNCGPPVLLPQVSGNQVTQIVKNPELINDEKKTEEDDDWEFQDFKSTPSDNCETLSSNYQTVPSVSKTDESSSLALPIQTKSFVLQPVKIEPIMPTLNWPDPGEVKHSFDDFTEFISNSTWSEKSTTCTISETVENKSSNVRNQAIDFGIENEKVDNGDIAETRNDKGGFDDDFNTFQSALPSRNQLDALPSINNSNIEKITSLQQSTVDQITPSNSNLEDMFQKVKSDTISFTSVAGLTSKNNLPYICSLQTKILQPTPANNSVQLIPNQQKSGQILQPLSLESYSQINWPSPGIDLQDLSRFNPVDTLHSLKSELSTSSQNKNSPVHHNKKTANNQAVDDDIWGEFVSSKPKQQPTQTNKNHIINNDDDEWSDFVSSSKPQNGLNTISLNVHTNSNMQKTANKNKAMKNDQMALDIPTLNYITPKTNNHNMYRDKHFQNL